MLEKPTSCVGCPLYTSHVVKGVPVGFSHPTGTGKNGVMIVAEALGKDEELEGRGLVGKSGYALFQQLRRVSIDREDFTIFNTIACRPPDNKLVGMPYEREALERCRPNLEDAIKGARATAKEARKTFVIVTLGVTPFKAILGLDSRKDAELLKKDYYAYPFYSAQHGAWVIAAPHPAFLLRGNTHLWPVVQFVFKRALEIALGGMKIDSSDYTLDPDSAGFDRWLSGYRRSLDTNPDNPLSYDIETPYKVKVKDEEEIGKEEDADHTILRIGFSYEHLGNIYTCSVKWSAEYMAGIEELFSIAKYVLGWNSDKYDYPRVSRHVEVKGIGLDGMVAWHILNSSLPKALGFVTPYYWQNTEAWKYLADKEPAFYNAKDAEAALRCWLGIKRDLIANRLWHVYERHWIELHRAIKYMTGIGVLRDSKMRDEAEVRLSTELDSIEKRMDDATPLETRELKIYKKAPKVISERMFETQRDYPVEYCSACGLQGPKRWKKHAVLCGGEPTSLNESFRVWAEPIEFKISKKRMSSYQDFHRHQAILDRKEHKITFNADAILLLTKKYPYDKLYPLILEHRKTQKLLSTYIGMSEYREVEVPNDYVLQLGEKWKDAL
jgi:uracil-DNA glycosylase family 4